MQSRDDGERGNGKSTLGELTLVGAQWGANFERDVLANTLLKDQLRLPHGKLRRWLLETFQPCLKANHSSFGSHTVALISIYVCYHTHTLIVEFLNLWNYVNYDTKNYKYTWLWFWAIWTKKWSIGEWSRHALLAHFFKHWPVGQLAVCIYWSDVTFYWLQGIE